MCETPCGHSVLGIHQHGVGTLAYKQGCNGVEAAGLSDILDDLSFFSGDVAYFSTSGCPSGIKTHSPSCGWLSSSVILAFLLTFDRGGSRARLSNFFWSVWNRKC
jgi:hypothetical protein